MSDAQDGSNDPSLQTRLTESVLRITVAGFAGACVGLSHSHKASGAKIFQRAVATGTKKLPPAAVARLKTVQQDDRTVNHPLLWATSFMAFVSILETSRFWSPAGLLTDDRRVATVADLTIGGAVAGLALGLSQQMPPSSGAGLQLPLQGRFLLWSNLGTGIALGFLAGVCQAALDVAESYARSEDAKRAAVQEQLETERTAQYDREKMGSAAEADRDHQ